MHLCLLTPTFISCHTFLHVSNVYGIRYKLLPDIEFVSLKTMVRGPGVNSVYASYTMDIHYTLLE